MCILSVLIFIVGSLNAQLAPDIPIEYQVKAAFLYKFTKFIQWPEDSLDEASNTIRIGLVGKSPMKKALEAIMDTDDIARTLELAQFDGPQEITACHILFVDRSEHTHVEEILQAVSGSSTLTVGEIHKFAHRGGMINFIIEKGNVRFEINVKAAAEADLQISSKLLRLAEIVGGVK